MYGSAAAMREAVAVQMQALRKHSQIYFRLRQVRGRRALGADVQYAH